VPIPDDADPDTLISHLAGPLPLDARSAFRAAAEAALAQIPAGCWGEGVIYRAIAALQRDYFIPPDDHRASWDISQESRASKLRSAPAIGYGRARDSTRRLRVAE
jgi:hypothetical protein